MPVNTRDIHDSDTCLCGIHYRAERIPHFRTEMCANCGRPSIQELRRILAEAATKAPRSNHS